MLPVPAQHLPVRRLRLAVPAGTSVRFEPGIALTVSLAPLGGRRIVACQVVGVRPRVGVRVNPAFVRANEVRTLSGSAAKLESAIGPLESIPLENTLRWMLEG